MSTNDLKEFEKKTFCSFTIDTHIYDVELCSKVNDKMKSLKLTPDVDKIYEINIYFDKSVYGQKEFYLFPIERKDWQIEELKTLSGTEKRHTILNQVLSAQLQNICDEIAKFNVVYRNIRIIGDDFGGKNQVKIEINEDDETRQSEELELSTRKSKKSPTFRTMALVVPDYSYSKEQMAKVFAEMFIQYKQEEFRKSLHTPNLIDTEKVFNALANALIMEFPDKYISAEKIVKELLSQASLKKDWPLEIVSKDGKYGAQNDLGNELDCSTGYLIYIKQRHSWVLKEIADLTAAKQTILTSGYNRKYTDEIIVLHNLCPIQFDLFVEDKGEISPILKTEAHTAKKLLLRWKNK